MWTFVKYETMKKLAFTITLQTFTFILWGKKSCKCDNSTELPQDTGTLCAILSVSTSYSLIYPNQFIYLIYSKVTLLVFCINVLFV